MHRDREDRDQRGDTQTNVAPPAGFATDGAMLARQSAVVIELQSLRIRAGGLRLESRVVYQIDITVIVVVATEGSIKATIRVHDGA